MCDPLKIALGGAMLGGVAENMTSERLSIDRAVDRENIVAERFSEPLLNIGVGKRSMTLDISVDDGRAVALGQQPGEGALTGADPPDQAHNGTCSSGSHRTIQSKSACGGRQPVDPSVEVLFGASNPKEALETHGRSLKGVQSFSSGKMGH